jgi:nucleoside-diphosphate-sugar epimerase
MTKVLVLGGTGAMGKHLVNLLASDGFQVTVTSRNAQPVTENVRYIEGNAQDLRFLEKVLGETWDVIVDFMVYGTSAFKRRLALFLNSTHQYVFLSSSRVYADSREPIRENSPRLLDVTEDKEFFATDEYSLAKARQENTLIESGKKNWTIVRPYITYSEDRLQLGVLEKEEWLYRALHGRPIIFSKEISEKLTTLTYGLDVASAMKALIGNSQAMGEVYHITSNRSILWKDVLEIYLQVLEKHLGQRPHVLLLDIKKFLKCRHAKYQIIYDRMFDRCFDNKKMAEYVDLDVFHSVEVGLKFCLESFLKDPVFKNINWRSEAIKDRITGEVAILSEINGLKQKIQYLIFRFFRH